jgi:hypothetical protein
MAEFHRLWGLNDRHVVFPHSSGGEKSKIKVLSGLVSGEASLLCLQPSTGAHGLPSVCAQNQGRGGERQSGGWEEEEGRERERERQVDREMHRVCVLESLPLFFFFCGTEG